MNVIMSLRCYLSVILLAVSTVQSQKIHAAAITQAPQDAKVEEGETISFFCKASGNPKPDIYWSIQGRRINRSSRRYVTVDMNSGSVLRIEPVRIKRVGPYRIDCVASNGIGDPVTASANLTVYKSGNVPSGYPRIIENPSLKAVEKGRNTVVTCSAEGNPSPDIIWLKDYIPLNVNDVKFKLLNTGSLQILNSQPSDEGRYECVASNIVGVAYSYHGNIYVRVRRVPPHFSIPPPKNIVVNSGEDYNITCLAVGSPMPFVKWRHGKLQLTPEDSIPVGKNVLRLTNIRQLAEYTCVAASDLGNIEAVTVVTVRGAPMPPVSLHISEVTATSLKISWTAADIDPILSFIIQYKRKGSLDYTEETVIGQTEYTVHGLDQYTQYEFQVVALNDKTRSIPSKSVDVTTEELVTEETTTGSNTNVLTAMVTTEETTQNPHEMESEGNNDWLHDTLTPIEMTVWRKIKDSRSSQITASLMVDHLNRCLEEGILAPWALGLEVWDNPLITDEVKTQFIEQEKQHAIEKMALLRDSLNSIGETDSIKALAYTDVLGSMLDGTSSIKFKASEELLDAALDNLTKNITMTHQEVENTWREMPASDDQIWNSLTQRSLKYDKPMEKPSNKSVHNVRN